jgi:calcium binding protein 39
VRADLQIGRGACQNIGPNEICSTRHSRYVPGSIEACQALLIMLETESSPEQVYALVTGMIQEDLLYSLAVNLHRLPFESRKDAQVIFSYVLRFRPATASPKSDPLALSYVVNNRPEVLVELCNGYDHKESATPAGTVLREVLKSDSAAAIILYDDPVGNPTSKGLTGVQPEAKQSGKGVFWKFFNWIDQGSFEVGADAFTTFRVSRRDSHTTSSLTFCRNC